MHLQYTIGCTLQTIGRHILRCTFLCVVVGEIHTRCLSKRFRYAPYTYAQAVCWALSITQDIPCIQHFTSWSYSYLPIGWLLYQHSSYFKISTKWQTASHPQGSHSIQTTATSLKIKELLHHPKRERNQILNQHSKYISCTGYRNFPKI